METGERTRYRIERRWDLDCDESEQLRALRWLLKRAGRQYGLKCVLLQMVNEEVEDRKDVESRLNQTEESRSE